MQFTLPFFWYDTLEIMIISYMIHRFTRFLATHHDMSLVNALYSYIGMICVSTICHMQILSITLLASAPIFITLGIIFHQRTLQKNYVLRKQQLTTITSGEDWKATLVSFCLTRVHNHQSIFLVIEYSDAIDIAITHAFMLNAPVSKPLLDIASTSTNFQSTQHIWIHASGVIKAINSSYAVDATIASDWHMNALALSDMSDAIICKGNPQTGTFDIAFRNKIYHNISSNELYALLKSHTADSSIHSQGSFHDITHRTHKQARP